jgi:hypothetical protein
MAKLRKRLKSSGERDDQNRKEVLLLLPLTFNDQTEIPRATLESIFDELYIAFHGWTVRGTVRGAYRMKSGAKQVEDLLEVSVVLDERQLPELERMVAAWCGLLGQEEMLMKITDSVVKFIPPRLTEEQP